jgi:ABC-type nitrate/sulfonate/bicarbonate transport system substrate-binding protein
VKVQVVMRKMNRSVRWNASCGLWWLILCLLLLPACQGAPSASAPAEAITVALPSPPLSTLFDIAIANGYFLQEGLAVTYQSFESGKLALQAMFDGKADLAISAGFPVMVAISGGQPISIVAQVATVGNNLAIVARKDRGIAEPADLAGKTIGVTFGTSAVYFLDSFLSLHGIARTEVTRNNINPSEMSATLAAGTVDAVVAWNPWNLLLQKEWGDRGIVFTDEIFASDPACLSGQTVYLTDHPQAIVKFLRGLIQAETLAKLDPAEGQQLEVDFTHLTPEQVAETWPSLDLRVSLDQALLVGLEDQTRWAQANQIVSGTTVPNYLDYIYFAGLEAVRPKSITIIH